MIGVLCDLLRFIQVYIPPMMDGLDYEISGTSHEEKPKIVISSGNCMLPNGSLIPNEKSTLTIKEINQLQVIFEKHKKGQLDYTVSPFPEGEGPKSVVFIGNEMYVDGICVSSQLNATDSTKQKQDS